MLPIEWPSYGIVTTFTYLDSPYLTTTTSSMVQSGLVVHTTTMLPPGLVVSKCVHLCRELASYDSVNQV